MEAITPGLATLLAGVVSAIAAIIVSAITSNSQTKLIVYRLEQLENKVNAHNKLDIRMTASEESEKFLKEKVNALEIKLNSLIESKGVDRK